MISPNEPSLSKATTVVVLSLPEETSADVAIVKFEDGLALWITIVTLSVILAWLSTA